MNIAIAPMGLFCGALPHTPQGSIAPLTPCRRRDRRFSLPQLCRLKGREHGGSFGRSVTPIHSGLHPRRTRTQGRRIGNCAAMVKRGIALWGLAVLVVATLRCDGQNSEFACGLNQNGWQRCVDNKIRYCHATTEEDGHFHWGQKCVDQGLLCEIVGERKAACIDKTKACQANEAKCENNTVYTCINGFFSVTPCGTAKTCTVEGGSAQCKSNSGPACNGHGDIYDGKCECNKGYKVDASDATKCIAE
ncbi:hypothetical protein L6R29_15630 [Myxococcota bacterium]|nr:hypothetical protein [Myxococcota bacterium]